MFTGLVEATGSIGALTPQAGGARLRVESPLSGFELGESVSVNGACLTVVHSRGGSFEADLSAETLARTNLGRLAAGARVNLERSLRVGDRLGGHWVLGHVDAVVPIVDVRPDGDARRVTVELSGPLSSLVAAKGSVALDGVSLTVNQVSDDRFSVMLIPHTLSVTTLGAWQRGSELNFEADVLARYVARLSQAPGFAETVGAQAADDRLRAALEAGGFTTFGSAGSGSVSE